MRYICVWMIPKQEYIKRPSVFMKAWVTKRFGRVMHLQICTKLSAGIYPRFHEIARYTLYISFIINLLY